MSMIGCIGKGCRKRMRYKRYIERNPDDWNYIPIPYKKNCKEFIQYKIKKKLNLYDNRN